ncbi:MAG TPA: hypothetical protein VGN14_09010 [Candidatus Elarobacter sp.]
MTAPPMRPWQNLLALVATILAAGALLPLPTTVRLVCVGTAVGLIVLVLTLRLRAHRTRRERERVDDVYGRIERIRSERGRRRH